MTTIQTIEERFEEQFCIVRLTQKSAVAKLSRDQAELVKQFIRQQFEALLGEIVPEKKEECRCDEDKEGFGYHTKNCTMFPYGYNRAVDDFIQRAAERGVNIK